MQTVEKRIAPSMYVTRNNKQNKQIVQESKYLKTQIISTERIYKLCFNQCLFNIYNMSILFNDKIKVYNQNSKTMSREGRKRDPCTHSVYIKGLCGNCGARLDPPRSTSVSMIHSVPELKVSQELAKEIGKDDQMRLINDRKLVLLVDLDQTLLHTTHEEVKNNPNIHSFTLWPGHPTYYTKLRPYLKDFLDEMSEIYELHIFTFGCRKYAHKIASLIDPDKKYFGNRILSRDESVDQYSKKGNLNNLFPCGDAMVCIIDDRSDVWRDAGNLIQVKPYSYFKTSISDGAQSTTVEDEESLKRDVDELEALLGISGDDSEDSSEKNDVNEKSDEEEKGDKNEEQEEEKSEEEDQNKKDEVDEKSETEDTSISPPPAKQTKKLPAEETSPPSPGENSSTSNDTDEIDDPDDHLLYLPNILKRIHDKWYMELDEQTQFLTEGESYKLPDIKDIIRKYLRKKL